MEGRVWEQLREIIAELPVPPQLDHRCTYSTRLILLIACYAYLKDRPQNWACDPANWPPDQRPHALPHPGQFSRRLNTPAVAKLFEQLWDAANTFLGPPAGGTAAVDGKALTIGGSTTDRDATRGRAGGGFGCGYKLHAIVAAMAAWQQRQSSHSTATRCRSPDNCFQPPLAACVPAPPS